MAEKRGKERTKLPDFNKIARMTLILAGDEMQRILKHSETSLQLDQKAVLRLMDLQKLTQSILKEKSYKFSSGKHRPKSQDIIDKTIIDDIDTPNDTPNDDIID